MTPLCKKDLRGNLFHKVSSSSLLSKSFIQMYVQLHCTLHSDVETMMQYSMFNLKLDNATETTLADIREH